MSIKLIQTMNKNGDRKTFSRKKLKLTQAEIFPSFVISRCIQYTSS